MRRMLIVVFAVSAVLVWSRPAQAFHRRYEQPVGPGPVMYQPASPYMASPTVAAPVSPALILQLLGLGYQFLNSGQGQTLNLGQGNLFTNNRTTTTTQPEPVPTDVVQTIKAVDDSLPAVVDKSNGIKAMNHLFDGVADVPKFSATTTTDNTSGAHRIGKSGPPPKQ